MPPAGTDIGGFVLRGPLGRGGMGTVVEAVDPGLDRRVAVKFLRDGFLRDERILRRFSSEGKALAKVEHPHVVRVHAVGEWEGWPYLVMEYVQGAPLARRLDEGPLPVAEALRTAEELAGALAAIHDRRIVHRDVNPSNCILREEDGALCLVDFGLARELDRSSATSGTIAGTPLYMAPEQMMGRSAGARADVYSFGSTLFELITGAPPFAEVPEAAFFHTVRDQDPPLLRTLRPEAPREVEVLVARALSRAPEFRQEDGAALLAELRAIRGAGGRAAPPERVAEGPPAVEAAPQAPPEDPQEALPLLGRDAEYGRALAVLDGALGRRGGLLLVEGEPGSGKTRFLAEVERAARARAMGILRCQGEEFSRAPFRAFRTMVREAAAEAGDDEVPAILRRAARADAANEPLLPALRWFFGTGGDAETVAPARTVLRKAVLAALRALLAERPGLLVAEDIHLLDEGSLDLLAAVAGESHSWPLAVAVSYRPPDDPLHGEALAARLPLLQGAPHATPLRMGPLDEPAVATLIHRMLGAGEVEARRLAPVLLRKSAGNPLYLVESLRVLEPGNRLHRKPTKGGVRRRLTSLEIPPRLMELAVHRIAKIPREEKDALGVVSTDPSGVGAEVVARCLEISRLAALRILQQLGRERGIVLEKEGLYSVAHSEVRQAVYADLLPELREAYHAEIARTLLGGGAAKADPAGVGFHLRYGGRPQEALPLLLDGGRRMLEAGAALTALECFEAAAACAAQDGSPEADLGRAEALEGLGEHEEVRSILARLADEGRGDLDAILVLARFERDRGNTVAEGRCLEWASSHPGATPLQSLRLESFRAQFLSRKGDREGALAALAGSEEKAREAPPRARLRFLNTRAVVHWRFGMMEEALRGWERSLALAEETGAVEETAVILGNLSLVCTDLDRLEEALAWAEKAEERAALMGSERSLAYGRLQKADVLMRLFRYDEAEAAIVAAEEVVEGLESREANWNLAARRWEMALCRGRAEEALRWAERGMEEAAERPLLAAGFRATKAQTLLRLGRAGEALAEARAAHETLRSLGEEDDAEEALAFSARALRASRSEGPEREAMRALGRPRCYAAALEAAREAKDEEARRRWISEAKRLAQDAWERAEVRDGSCA